MPRTDFAENPNPNPHYGDGCYRRRIRLSASSNCVVAELEDDCHGFRVELRHNGRKVTGLSGDTLRIPMNTCAGALGPLQDLIGIALDAAAPTIVAQVNPRSNCTHLYDLALLAMAHPALDHSPMLGVCYSYSEGVVEEAIRNHNSVRDFTDKPEQLLKFV